jgi:hypothetical protein
MRPKQNEHNGGGESGGNLGTRREHLELTHLRGGQRGDCGTHNTDPLPDWDSSCCRLEHFSVEACGRLMSAPMTVRLARRRQFVN